MADPLKEMFNAAYYSNLAQEFGKVYAHFDQRSFLTHALEGLEALSLNERLRRTSICLQKHLPLDYPRALDILYQVIPNLQKGYTALVFPDYVGLYGLEQIELSMQALKYFTQFGSSEFAIRVFLKKDFKKSLETMLQWAEDDNMHVRRLASEGCRPRLPWSFKLDDVIKDPASTLPILDKLKADKELYVRKSVANHLNDISKDNPDYVLQLLHSWQGNDKHTQWIIKHGARTLLKRGHQEVLLLFGVPHSEHITVSNLQLTPSVALGQELQFSFEVQNNATEPILVRLEYLMHYMKKGGQPSKKIFQIAQKVLAAQERLHISRKYSFKPITTRVYYVGLHGLSIVVNGTEHAKKEFELRA